MGQTQAISRHLAGLPSPADRAPLVVDAVQDAVFEISNVPPLSKRPPPSTRPLPSRRPLLAGWPWLSGISQLLLLIKEIS